MKSKKNTFNNYIIGITSTFAIVALGVLILFGVKNFKNTKIGKDIYANSTEKDNSKKEEKNKDEKKPHDTTSEVKDTQSNKSAQKKDQEEIIEKSSTISITSNEAKQILIKNIGTNWNNIPIDFQYIAKVKYNSLDYYTFIEYADNNFMYMGGEWLEQTDNGKYYVSTYFVPTSYEESNNIACNYAKDYNNTKNLTNDSAYNGFIYDNWCNP